MAHVSVRGRPILIVISHVVRDGRDPPPIVLILIVVVMATIHSLEASYQRSRPLLEGISVVIAMSAINELCQVFSEDRFTMLDDRLFVDRVSKDFAKRKREKAELTSRCIFSTNSDTLIAYCIKKLT